MSDSTRHCWIYRASRKDEMYVYLAKEEDFDIIPDVLRKKMGRLDLAMELDIGPETKLARVSADKVQEGLEQNGFFIQMPPEPLKPDLYFGE